MPTQGLTAAAPQAVGMPTQGLTAQHAKAYATKAMPQRQWPHRPATKAYATQAIWL